MSLCLTNCPPLTNPCEEFQLILISASGSLGMSFHSGVSDKCYSDNLVHTFNCRLLLKQLQITENTLSSPPPKKKHLIRISFALLIFLVIGEL